MFFQYPSQYVLFYGTLILWFYDFILNAFFTSVFTRKQVYLDESQAPDTSEKVWTKDYSSTKSN